jgi:hypothetical protein
VDDETPVEIGVVRNQELRLPKHLTHAGGSRGPGPSRRGA